MNYSGDVGRGWCSLMGGMCMLEAARDLGSENWVIKEAARDRGLGRGGSRDVGGWGRGDGRLDNGDKGTDGRIVGTRGMTRRAETGD